MQTRTVKQILIFKLFLNENRFNVPDMAAIGFDEVRLSEWVNSIKTESYTEDIDIEDGDNITKLSLKKDFIKGSKLENYNLDEIEGYKYGVFPQWINDKDFDKFRQEYPTLPIID